MAHILYKSVGSLSAGQSTCAMLAKAFIGRPELVLLDEPSASLDPQTAHDVRQFIIKYNKLHQTSILITSHNMNEVYELCHRVIILKKGSIVANDRPQVLINSMSHLNLKLTFDDGFLVEKVKIYLEERQLHWRQKENIIIINIEERSIPGLLSYLGKYNMDYVNIDIQKPTLEDYFLYLAGEEK